MNIYMFSCIFIFRENPLCKSKSLDASDQPWKCRGKKFELTEQHSMTVYYKPELSRSQPNAYHHLGYKWIIHWLITTEHQLIKWLHKHVSCRCEIACFQHSLTWIESCTNTNISVVPNSPSSYTVWFVSTPWNTIHLIKSNRNYFIIVVLK